jgi:rhodanese-related sulfurtransferase
VTRPWRSVGAFALCTTATLICVSAGDDSSPIEVEPERVAEWLTEDPAPQVIDVREPYEREAGHIEGTRHIELVNLTEQAGSVERDRPVVFYCRLGSRSLMAAQAFRASGYEAYSMSGGLVRWADEGRALSPQGGHVAEH